MSFPSQIFLRGLAPPQPARQNTGRRFLLTGLAVFLAAAAMLTESRAFAQNGISLAQFDSFIFQQQGVGELTRERLESSIDLQVRRIQQSTQLRDEQKQQLRLAGQGDIQHFFNRVVAARQQFQALDPAKADFREAYEIAAPLQMELMRGLFGEDSMFAKVVRTTLDKEQLEAHQEQEAIRRHQEKEANVRMYISSMEANLPITAAQREALVQLASAQLGELRPNSRLHMQLVAYRLFTIPDEKMAEIFDAGQMAAFRKMRSRMGDVEQILRQQGVLDDDAE